MLQQDRENDDDAFDEAIEEGRDLGGDQDAFDHLEHDRAQERAGDHATTAGHCDSTDRNAGDGVQFKGDARVRRCDGGEPGGQQERCQARQQACDGEGHRLDAIDMDAGQFCGLFVGTDGVDIPAKFCFCHHQ